MALREVRDRQQGFGGGVNTTSDDSALQPTEFRVGINTQLDLRGAARKRRGTQRVLTSAFGGTVLGGYSWAQTSSRQELMVASGTLYTGTLSIPMTVTSRGGTFSTSVYPMFAPFRGPSSDGVYIADGGALCFWDGAALTSRIVNTPNVEAIVAWGPRLFGMSGTTLYWSGTTGGINGHTLGAAAGGGQAIVRTFGGQSLVAGVGLRSSLLLFHQSAISRFTGATQDDIDIYAGTQGLTADIGTVSKRSIVTWENAVFFLSDRGAFMCDENSVNPVSSPLERTLSQLSQSDWAKVSAVHARAYNEIRWSIPNVGVYAYNYRTQGWTGPWGGTYVTPEVSAMWDSKDSNSAPVVLLGNTGGSVYWCDRSSVYVDDVLSDGTGGTLYPWTVQCKRFYGQDYTQFKAWRTLYALGDFQDPANTTVQVTTSGGTYTFPLPYDMSMSALTLTWGDASTTWGATGTVWGGASTTNVERARGPLQGVHPWADVSFLYTGTKSSKVAVVDVLGYARRRR